MHEYRYTLKNVQQCVDGMVALKGDPEVAHETEGDLYRIVLEEVAAGNPEGREMARAALATKTIDFPRWCA